MLARRTGAARYHHTPPRIETTRWRGTDPAPRGRATAPATGGRPRTRRPRPPRREQDPGQGVRGRGAPLGHRAPDPLVRRDRHDVPPHAEPERVEQGEGDRGEPDHEGPGRGPAPGVQVLRPGDREQDRGQEEAPVRVRPQDGDRQRPQDAVRMPVPAREQPLREGEPEDPEELGPDQEAARQQDPRREGEPGGRPARGADVAARRVEQPGDGRRDRRTERRHREPPADVEEPSEDDLRPPLLVQPRRAEGRAREHVAAQDAARVQHEVAGPEVVREVDGRERDRRGDGRRHGDRGHDPHRRESGVRDPAREPSVRERG